MKTIKMLVLLAIIGMMALLFTNLSSAQTTPSTGGGSSGVVVECCDPQIKITSFKNESGKTPGHLVDGHEYTVTWESSNVPPDATVRVRLVTPYGQEDWGYNITDYSPTSGSFRFTARVLSERSEKYRLVVSVYLPFQAEGYYYDVKIAEASSKVFAILLPGKKRSITLTWPEKDITLVAGTSTFITWESVNLPANAEIELEAFQRNPVGDSSYFYDRVENTGGSKWRIRSDFVPGRYVIQIRYRNEYGMYGTPLVEVPFFVAPPKAQPPVIVEE